MSTKIQKKTASAIIVAAGDSRRMGNGVNKQLLLIDNIPVLAHTLSKFESANSIDSICIVTKPENIVIINDLVKEFGFKKVKSIVPGGKTRQQSVISGLNQIESNSMVAVHDGARPFASSDMIDKAVSAAYEYGAAAPGVVPKDTVKVSNTDNTVKSTPDRSTLRLIQTPQVFNRDELLLAYLRAEESGFCATDDCSVMENMGKQIHIVEGEYTNIKVTTPEDIPIAEGIYDFLKN